MELNVAEKHELRVAQDTLRTPDSLTNVLSDITKDEARKIIRDLHNKQTKE